MAEPLYVIRRALFAKLETTYATDAVPVAANDTVLLRSITPSPLNQSYAERTLVRGYYGGQDRLPTFGNVVIECEMEMAGFGVAGPAAPTPGYDALLRICGLSRTIDADTSVVYAPVTPATDSATMYFYQDGQLHKLFGARGTAKLRWARNEVPTYMLTITGLYGGIADVVFPSPDISAFVEPITCVPGNTTFSMMGVATLGLQSLELDFGNTVEHRNLPNLTESIRITQRAVKATIEIQHQKNDVYDWWTAVRAATKGALQVVHGTDAGNIIQLDAPRVMPAEPKFTENAGFVHLQMTADVQPTSAGNDEFALTIT